MKKKILATVVALILVCLYAPTAMSGTSVSITGTFTPSATLSITCNQTTPAFGVIVLDGESRLANDTEGYFNVSNIGEVNCSVAIIIGNGSGNWSAVVNASVPGATNKFSVMLDNTTAWYDLIGGVTIETDLATTPAPTNCSFFNLSVYISSFTNETAVEQEFYTNLTAAAAT